MQIELKLGYRILVVDDEPTVRRATTLLLKYDGHLVQSVDSGEAALETYAPGKFDLVITDNCMDGMSGGQLAALLKKRQPGQLIIMATAFADQSELADAITAGVDLVLNKPFSRDELREVIARIMSQSGAHLAGDLNFSPLPAPGENLSDRLRPSQ